MWQRPTRRRVPDDAATDRFDQELAKRLAGAGEELDGLVGVIGQQKSGDRVHLCIRLDLVNARGDGAVRNERRRTDQCRRDPATPGNRRGDLQPRPVAPP